MLAGTETDDAIRTALENFPMTERRHLDKGQKIALALDLEPFFAEEARKRQLAALETSPKRGGKVKGNVSQPIVPPGASPRAPQSRDQTAAAVGISGKLVSAAKAIKAADPNRFEKIKAGKLSIAKALGVSQSTVSNWLARTLKEEKERKCDKAFSLWQAGCTQEEIAEGAGIPVGTVPGWEKEFLEKLEANNSRNWHDFDPPIYNVWK